MNRILLAVELINLLGLIVLGSFYMTNSQKIVFYDLYFRTVCKTK